MNISKGLNVELIKRCAVYESSTTEIVDTNAEPLTSATALTPSGLIINFAVWGSVISHKV
ncbi:hypothetical protein D3C72_2141180 [compost metagenome]